MTSENNLCVCVWGGLRDGWKNIPSLRVGSQITSFAMLQRGQERVDGGSTASENVFPYLSFVYRAHLQNKIVLYKLVPKTHG